jgi:hypothetical protein
MPPKIMSDEELRYFLKKIKVDVLKIDHLFGPSGTCRSCVACDYVTELCWLCKQCVSCCEFNVKNISD